MPQMTKRRAKRQQAQAKPEQTIASHHDITTREIDANSRKQGIKILTRYEGLKRDGLIDVSQLLACDRFHKDWHIAEGVSAGGDGPGRVDHSTQPGGNDAQVDAGVRRRAALDSMAPGLGWLLVRVVVDDWSWVRIAAQIGLTDKTARAHAVQAIALLERYYDAVDNSRRRVA